MYIEFTGAIQGDFTVKKADTPTANVTMKAENGIVVKLSVQGELARYLFDHRESSYPCG